MTKAGEGDAVDCIRYMSSILHNARWRDSADTTSERTPPHSARFLNHLATMLDTGARGYSVAVTGAAGPQSTEAVVLVSSESGGAGPQALSGLEAVPVQIRSAREEKERTRTSHALQNPVPAPVPQVATSSDPEVPVHELPIAGHVADVLSFLEYARVSEPNRRVHVADQLMLWLVFRCWPKIALRLGSAAKEWKKDPVSIMREAPAINIDLDGGSAEILILTPFVVDLLGYGLSPDDPDDHTLGKTKYTLTQATAPLWLKCIGNIVDSLRNLLPPEAAPHADALYEVDRLLRVLAQVLQPKPISSLFVDNSYWSAHLEAHSYAGVPPRNFETDEAVPARTRNYGRYLFQWLKTLVALHTAAVRVVPQMGKHQSLKATLVRLSKNTRVDLRAMSFKIRLIDDIQNTLGWSDEDRSDACGWIEAHATADHFYGNVHAEAGLMAVAYMIHTDAGSFVDQPSTRKAFENQNGQLSIGMSSQCCWLCQRLGDLLFELHREPTSQSYNSIRRPPIAASTSEHESRFNAWGSPVVLHLPGTRGFVRPWEPPPFGVPASVLEQLASELTDLTKNVAFEMGPKPVLRPLSPVSSGDEFETSMIPRRTPKNLSGQ